MSALLVAARGSTRKRGGCRHRTCSLRNVEDVRHVWADNAMTAGEDGSENEDAHRLPERDRLQPEHGRYGVIPDPAEHKHEDDEADQGPSNEQNRSCDGIHSSLPSCRFVPARSACATRRLLSKSTKSCPPLA